MPPHPHPRADTGRPRLVLPDAVGLGRVLDQMRAWHPLDIAALARLVTQTFVVDLDLLAPVLSSREPERRPVIRSSLIRSARKEPRSRQSYCGHTWR
ncbi:hypothetical protein M446_2838 [Methylobacterium sp. 4-46]|nr:hypothetical protein M446_2838 [Methylobacterium sp. 4-46]